MNRVSCHTNLSGIGDREVYQIFLGSPRQYSKPNASSIRGINKELVIHSPYWVQLARDPSEKSAIATLNYAIEVAKEMERVGQKYYVTHIGARLESVSVARAMDYIRQFCYKWLWETRETNVIMCLENDSGSKKGTKMGSVKVLSRIVEDINDPRIKMTFDTEHAYANGFDLSDRDKLEFLKDKVAVVHFNSIPDYVGKGSHLDRHSTTRFEECKNGFDYLYNVYEVLYDGVRPFIMEIDSDLVEGNLEFLSTYLIDRRR